MTLSMTLQVKLQEILARLKLFLFLINEKNIIFKD